MSVRKKKPLTGQLLWMLQRHGAYGCWGYLLHLWLNDINEHNHKKYPNHSPEYPVYSYRQVSRALHSLRKSGKASIAEQGDKSRTDRWVAI